jgi:hypothetical protein
MHSEIHIYGYDYISVILRQINYDYDDLFDRVMKGANVNGHHELIDTFCERIGLDEYRNYDQVIRHIRNNENLHDYWAL